MPVDPLYQPYLPENVTYADCEPAPVQTTADRLAGINRCLDALEVVVTCLKHTESGRQAQHKAACEEHLKNLKAALHSWADYERDRLT